jgi:hypothetical protein
MKKQTEAERYASVFTTKEETRARHAAEVVVETLVACAERGGCPYCELDEAHLHGAVLYGAGRRLF